MKKKVEELTILDLANMAKAYGAYAEKVVLKKEKQDDSDFFFVFEMGFFEKDKVKIGEISVELGNSEQEEEEE